MAGRPARRGRRCAACGADRPRAPDRRRGETARGQVALVTGASRGLGAAVAIELARLGARPVLVARTQGGLEETDDAIRAAGGEATLLPLDLTEGEQIEAIGPSLLAALRPAGHPGACRRGAGPADAGARISSRATGPTVVGVNLTAGWHLIRTCDPLLRAAEAGRAVVVTDGLTRDAAGLLGRLWRDQGGAGAPGADLGGRRRGPRGCG